jgi:hypothetical protein
VKLKLFSPFRDVVLLAHHAGRFVLLQLHRIVHIKSYQIKTMHQQWRLCLYLGLMASTVAATTDWPVFFEHLGLVHSVHNKWDLTLSMQLHVPKLEARILKTIHRLRLLSGKYEKETEAAFRSDQEKSRLEELQESWTKLNRQLSRRAETMRRRTRNLKNLGSSSNTQPKRKKRQTEGIDGVDAVLQLTGGVLQSLFSVAYTEDVKKVVARIDKIDDDLSQDIKVVRTSQSDLQTNTKQTLNKQDNTIHMMEKMAKKIERKVCCFETIICCCEKSPRVKLRVILRI